MRLHKEGIIPISVAAVVVGLCIFLFLHFTDLSVWLDVLVVLLLLLPF